MTKFLSIESKDLQLFGPYECIKTYTDHVNDFLLYRRVDSSVHPTPDVDKVSRSSNTRVVSCGRV